MKVREEIIFAIEKACAVLNLPKVDIVVEHPADERYGDYATNAALVCFKAEAAREKYKNPRELAQELVEELKKDKGLNKIVPDGRIEVAGGGFINFFLRQEFLLAESGRVLRDRKTYGRGDWLEKKKVIVEFTDPNPFKEFHIGHLMSNAIGESLSRLFEFSGAELKRACYQGDVGMHVAKSIWGLFEKMKLENISLDELAASDLQTRIHFLGQAYALGATKYKDDKAVEEEINRLNKTIYEKSDENVQKIYDLGRKWSLDYFETIYAKLGTKFDFFFFESEMGKLGIALVKEYLAKGVFEESQGAVVFPAEKSGIHTRVFINSLGLPTYEAKELGLVKAKHDRYPYDWSVIVTGNEINEYFKVLLSAMKLIYPELADKTTHIGHGMLRLKSGKMSSRTGKVVTGESLIDDVTAAIRLKMEGAAKKAAESEESMITAIAVGAIKYSMLKQGPGKDIIFDFESSLSFEGDSGPYLQYVYARTKSVLAKSGKTGEFTQTIEVNEEELAILRWLYRFGEVTEAAAKQLSPNLVCSYLTELAQRFNTFYNKHQILNVETESFRLGLAAAVGQVMENGLILLGIEAPERM